MARTELTVQTIDSDGLEATYAAANADGNMVEGDGETFLHIKNGSAGDITVTIQSAETRDGLAVADQAVVVTAGEERFIGPFRTDVYNRAAGATDAGKVYIDYSGVTSLTVAALTT